MTIFRLYAQNGHCAGFWVQHRLWTNICALVKSVNGHRSGQLPENAECRSDADVMMQVFDVRSGRPVDPELPPARDRHFIQIAEPGWVRARQYARAVFALSRNESRRR